VIYELRFKSGHVERVETGKWLSQRQACDIAVGRAQLVGITDSGQVLMLADVEEGGSGGGAVDENLSRPS
jgi:hypothetical protein